MAFNDAATHRRSFGRKDRRNSICLAAAHFSHLVSYVVQVPQLNVPYQLHGHPAAHARLPSFNPLLCSHSPRPLPHFPACNVSSHKQIPRQRTCNLTPESLLLTWEKLVLVTGGSQGLGEAMGVEFAKRGADVVLVSRSEEKLKLALQNVKVSLVLTGSNGRLRGCRRIKSLAISVRIYRKRKKLRRLLFHVKGSLILSSAVQVKLVNNGY